MKQLFTGFVALLLAGCTHVGLELANLPAKFSTTRLYKDVDYGALPVQKLDIYVPQLDRQGPLPVVVFFYGGRWSDGSKEMYPFVAEAFAEHGYVTVIADYSKYPQVRFPAFIEDGAKAVAWVHRHIHDYGGNPERLFLAGHSSGAHIGALLAADERYLSAEGLSSDVIKAFAGLAGPYDFIPQAEDLKQIFGPPERYPQMQVPTFIDGGEPPMLLMWGEEDQAVWRRNMDRLSAAIREQEGRVETRIYPDLDHVGVIASLTWFLRGQRPVYADILSFFEKHRAP
ncbi:alpha/beta hydrolase [Marinobacterium litorale]|uniref:alpha/beta hydrolase n=1 Tax=Marinobacterium litorale TaxID=404770 RepID=UPI000419AE10|nr:alpha/beta hydrolase [Marinobacterium litorale]